MSVLFNSAADALSYDAAHPAWVTGTLYSVGDKVSVTATYTYSYICTTGGEAGGSTPTGTGTGISDGVCVWDCIQYGPATSLFVNNFASGGLTIAMWVKPTADGTGVYYASMATNEANNEGWHFSRNTSNQIVCDKRSTGGSPATSTNTVTVAGGWHHVAIVCAANGTGTKNTYINGTAGTAENTIRNVLAAPTQLRFGEWTSGSGDAACYMAHAALYKTVLSSTEIGELYNGGSGGGGKNPLAVQAANLAAYWSFTEGSITPSLTSQDTGAYTLTNANVTYSTDNPTVDAQPSTNKGRMLLMGVG